MAKTRRTPRAAQPITTVVVRSIEPVDIDGFLDAYARAIVEAKGTGPTSGQPTPPASTEAA